MGFFDQLFSRVVGSTHDPDGDTAIIELLTLVSMADGRSGVDERDQIRAFVDGRDWPASANPEAVLLTAMRRSREAIADSTKLDELLDDICDGLAASRYRSFALEIADDVAESDDEVLANEQSIIAHVRRRLSPLGG